MDILKAILLAAFSLIVGLLSNLWYTKTVIKKLKAEIIKYAGENLEKLQSKRRAYDNSIEECKQIALKLISELDNRNCVSIAKTRESLCTALYNKAIPFYVELIEWEQLLSKDNPNNLSSIAEDVVAELRRFKNWLRIINHRKFITEMQLIVSTVSKRTLDPFSKILDELKHKNKSTEELMLKNEINELLEIGLDSK